MVKKKWKLVLLETNKLTGEIHTEEHHYNYKWCATIMSWIVALGCSDYLNHPVLILTVEIKENI